MLINFIYSKVDDHFKSFFSELYIFTKKYYLMELVGTLFVFVSDTRWWLDTDEGNSCKDKAGFTRRYGLSYKVYVGIPQNKAPSGTPTDTMTKLPGSHRV